ncbi:MAG TPA: uroporphyrinogen-III synthase, partial [Blastocatellia bacterium]|nr:uroporphyrinogen-III synthase [Blastocatellia bacterium]
IRAHPDSHNRPGHHDVLSSACLAIIAAVGQEGKRQSGDALPLSGRTIVVTRAESQAVELIDRLESRGARVVSFPTIAFADPVSWATLDAAVTNLTGYDWVVFTSANGVKFFMLRMKERHAGSMVNLQSRSIAAIGPATATALEAEHIVAAVVADDSTGEGALAALVKHVGGEVNIKGLRFLIPRATIARNALPDGLRKLGADVDAVEAYRTIKPAGDVSPLLRLFEEHQVDAVTFTSSSTVTNFAEMVGVKDLSEFLSGIAVACIGPVTAATAAEFGIRDAIQPASYTARSLAELLVRKLG